ncbi:MAG: ABC transporter ATP-binding protein/permease [Eubacteriaceae bacterium]|nr:ABC transporter ATP-binding protein/permease [Eubacteriaceae bacterium]
MMMMMMGGEKPKNVRGTIFKLLNYIGAFKLNLALVVVAVLSTSAIHVITPRIQGQAIDQISRGSALIIQGTGTIDFAALGRLIITLCGFHAVSMTIGYLQNILMGFTTNSVAYRLRNEIYGKIHRLPLSYYDKTSHGDVLSRITNDVQTITMTMNQFVSQLVSSVVSIVGVFIMMLTLSWQLTLFNMLVLPLSTVGVTFIVKRSQTHFRNQQEFLARVNGHIEEMFGSHVVVKAFNGETESLSRFSVYNDALYNSAWRANFLSGLMMPMNSLIGNIAYIGICVLGGYFSSIGRMSIGDISAFLTYSRNFQMPINQISNVSNMIQQTAAAAERVFAFLEEEEEPQDAEDALVVSDETRGENIAFEHVRFGYLPDTVVIKDFSAAIDEGQRIAIVGPTGAGKTTIVKLLMRFYDVDSGQILLNGINIKDYKRNELRKVFGMVLQDTWLFNGTIADNIKYGKENATDEEMITAAQAAQVDFFVRTLPNGYDLVLNEEADNISQGQKQLITIARALLSDPDVLILDEATSSVDTRTEILIQRAMGNLMKGRTSFIIAHRLSTIRNADLILAINNGDIVEQGSHEELLEKGGFYADLYNAQFEEAMVE